MADNIRLAEFDIDIDAVVKSAAELKKSIDAIKEAQKSNTLETDDQNEAYAQNEAALKALNKEYQEHLKAINNAATATADAANRQELMNVVLSQEVSTIAQAREQNKLLNKLRNEANLATAEGQSEILRLNAALDANNDFIRENVDALSQQKINVGNYTESIREAFSLNSLLTGGLAGLKTALTTAATGFMSMVKAGLVFLATPIGAAIGAIALVVALLYNAFKQFTPIVDKVEQVFAGLSAVVTAIKNTFIALVTGTKSLGEAFSGLSGDMDDAYKSAVALKKAQQDLEDAMKEQELQSARNRAEINRLNIQAKDRTKSEEERLALLEKASQVETQDFEQRKKNSDEALRQAYEQIRIEGSLSDSEFKELKKRGLAYKEYFETKASGSDELFDKLQETLIKETEIENEFYSNQEKNINKQNKLIEDAEAAREKSIAEGQKRQEEQITKQKEILDLYIAEQGTRARTLQEELALEETLSAKRKAILEQELKAKKLSQEAYKTALIEIDTDLARRRAELSVDNAMREIEANRMSLEKQREDKLFLNQELANQRKLENETILLQEQELAKLRLQNGLINQQEFDDAIRELSEINRIANKEIDTQREAIEKQERAELRAIEFEEDLAKLLEEGTAKFEIQQLQNDENRALELQKLAEQREQGALSEELYNARLNNINKKYDKIRQDQTLANEKALSEQRLNIASQMFGALGAIVDKNSSFGKALAVSQALINTYKGITSALETPSLAGKIAGVAMASATGFKAVKEILSTKVPKADGGTISGGSSASVGSASTDLRSLAPNESNLTSVSASGNATVQQQIQTNANQTGLSDSISNAVAQGAEAGTRAGSEQGLTNLSDNRNIRTLSTT